MWGKKMQNSWADNQREHYGKLAGAVRRLLCSFIVLKPEKIIVLLLFFSSSLIFLFSFGWRLNLCISTSVRFNEYYLSMQRLSQFIHT